MAYKINPFTGELDRVLSPGGGTASVSFATDAGTATPTATGVVTIAGGTGLATSGAGSTVTVTLNTPVTVANGGTGQSSYTNGQLLIGNTTGNTLNKATITAGAGITVTNGAGSITIASTAGGFTWTEVTGVAQAMAVENGYIANNIALVTLTLPAVAALGEVVQVVGKGTGLFRIAQNGGQTIHFIDTDTTTGATGSLTAIEQYATIEIMCITANSDWAVMDSSGNFTIV
jgi:hypothetical protein